MAEAARRLTQLPSVERVLVTPAALALLAGCAREPVIGAVRQALADARERIRAGQGLHDTDLTADAIARRAAELLVAERAPRVRRVVNATGVVLHTNLGRALLAREAVDAVARAAAEPVALEFDLTDGRRGERDRLVEDHLRSLTGAEAATVVNNNAAAVLLTLNALAAGREVVVSRGELIEIGGSFRIPDIMAKSGARLCEVGTTNRTHVQDYERAINPRTALLLKVHTSNYRVVGFTSQVDVAGLRRLADHHRGVRIVEDLGAGALVDLARWGLPAEPLVASSVAAGADLVLFSGDKLLGGPQCGLIVGRAELVERIRSNPLKRALRCDKLVLAALEATLAIYRFDPYPERRIPVLQTLVRPLGEIEELGRKAVGLLGSVLGDAYRIELVPSEAQAGSGSQPTVKIPSWAVAISSSQSSAETLAEWFRGSAVAIVGRIEHDRFLLDLRAVAQAEDLVPQRP
jgi:L-seryl-tRNA(Ser) seleniumtransferase